MRVEPPGVGADTTSPATLPEVIPVRRWQVPWTLMRVTGPSMSPVLDDGDLLLVRRAGWYAGRPLPVFSHAALVAELVVGELVVADLPGGRGLGVKQLIQIEPDGGLWVERASASVGTDSWVFGAIPAEDLVGVVRARVWPRPKRWRRHTGSSS